MSAIQLKLSDNPFQIEENEAQDKNRQKEEKEEKDKVIKGKSKTYIISKTLGKGTFGKVKLAYNIENKNEKYACKILLKSNIKDEDDYIRCKREMDILNKMHHVNVVRTYEIISTETTYYIFMDFCSKGELFNYIVKKQHLSEEKSAFFYYQLINGIEYIHKKGICHRDLKPENLLLTEKNKLKIIDFGLSNYFKGNLLETPCGSPCYASPEMVMGNKYNGFCIDIWSSGIILYAMLCGYLPFEEMENDEYNEVLFRNIVECNVEYPNELITPVAKDLLCKILVKDPKKRITIEQIKSHNFYLLGELLYKQTFENFGNMNEYVILENYEDEEKFIDFEELKNEDINDNSLNKKFFQIEEIFKKYGDDEDKKIDKANKKNKTKNNDDISDIIMDIKDYDIDRKNKTNNNSIGPLNKKIENNSNKKDKNKKGENQKTNSKNNDKKEKDILDKKYQIISEQKDDENIPENINQKEDFSRTEKSKKPVKNDNLQDLSELEEEKKQKKQLSMQNYNNIKLPINNNDKEKENKENILLENSINMKTYKTNKEEKSQKEYSIQEEYNNYNKQSNINLNPKDINFKNQYLKTEVYPSNSKHKTSKSHYQCKLLNKKLLSNNKIAFDNILKSLQNINNLKNKTPKRYTTKKKLSEKQKNHSNSLSRKKYSSYSPGIKKISKIGKNINSQTAKIGNFKKKNHIPLSKHSKNKNSYNILTDNIMKYFNNKFFFNFNNNNNKEYMMSKNFKPNKKFMPKKNKKIKNNNTNINTNNNINIINKENYFKVNANPNNEKKLFKNSVNNALNLKSFENCLSSNVSKKKHCLADNTNIKNNMNKINNLYGNVNHNIIRNQKNNLSKKSCSNLKGNNYLNNIYLDNSKPILVNSNNIRKSTDTLKYKKSLNSTNKSHSKVKQNSKPKSSKYRNTKNNTHNLLSHKMNNIYYKNNIDNNIIINFNILKPNIILEHKKAISRKNKMNKIPINSKVVHNNNLITSKVERHITENNFCSTMRNNFFFNRSSKNKNNNYKNIDMKQIKKSKEINQIIKSIQEMNKTQGNFNNTNQNNRKRLNTEF